MPCSRGCRAVWGQPQQRPGQRQRRSWKRDPGPTQIILETPEEEAPPPPAGRGVVREKEALGGGCRTGKHFSNLSGLNIFQVKRIMETN